MESRARRAPSQRKEKTLTPIGVGNYRRLSLAYSIVSARAAEGGRGERSPRRRRQRARRAHSADALSQFGGRAVGERDARADRTPRAHASRSASGRAHSARLFAAG